MNCLIWAPANKLPFVVPQQHTFGLITGNTKWTFSPNDFIKDDGKSINISLLRTTGTKVRFTKQLRCLPEQICKQQENSEGKHLHIKQITFTYKFQAELIKPTSLLDTFIILHICWYCYCCFNLLLWRECTT